MHFDVEDIVISKFHQLHCMNCKKNAIDEFLEFNMSNFHQLQNSNMSQKMLDNSISMSKNPTAGLCSSRWLRGAGHRSENG
jgi:hypothetical protein